MRLTIIGLAALLVGTGVAGKEAKPFAEIAIEGNHRWIGYFSFSGDGKVFAVSHCWSLGPSFVSLFDAASGKLLRRVDGAEGSLNYFALALSSDGKRLAVGGLEEIRIIDAESGKLLHRLESPHTIVRHLAFSPDGLTLASCGIDKEVILWDVKTGEKTTTLKHDRKMVFCVAFSSDGKKVAALGLDITEDEYASDWLVQVWDRATSKELSRVAGKAGETFSRPYLSPHGEMAVVRLEPSRLEVWDVTSGKLTSVIKGEGEGFGSGFELSPDNKSLVSVSYHTRFACVWGDSREWEA